MHKRLTFEEQLGKEVRSSGHYHRKLARGECQTSHGKVCTLCHASRITYHQEIPLKEKALRIFWAERLRSVPLAPLVSSALGRHYRTTTKRKVFGSRSGMKLGLIESTPRGDRGIEVDTCTIEPLFHSQLYRSLQQALNKPPGGALSSALTYAVTRGSYEKFALIFNVREISTHVVRSANAVSRAMTGAIPQITSVWLLKGDQDGDYYLGQASHRPMFRRIFGEDTLRVVVHNREFSFHPLSFSQVNQSLAGTLVSTAEDLLQLRSDDILLDLYSGYGLFSLSLAHHARSVFGVETSRESVGSAISNAKRLRIHNCRFIGSAIDDSSILKIFTKSGSPTAVILDPPRNGTAPGVIEAICAQRPKRVVHIFCNIDLVAQEITRWEKSGFVPTKAVPVDMFPGTSTMEVLVLLQPVK